MCGVGISILTYPEMGAAAFMILGLRPFADRHGVVLRVQAISLRDSPNIMISYYVVSFFVSLLEPAQQGTSRKDRPSWPSQTLARPLSSPGRGAGHSRLPSIPTPSHPCHTGINQT